MKLTRKVREALCCRCHTIRKIFYEKEKEYLKTFDTPTYKNMRAVTEKINYLLNWPYQHEYLNSTCLDTLFQACLLRGRFFHSETPNDKTISSV